MSDLLSIFYFVKDLNFKLNRKVIKGERNDKMTHKSKSKAFNQAEFECTTFEWDDSF